MKSQFSLRRLHQGGLLLGLCLAALSAQAERPDRGADYGGRGSSQSFERNESGTSRDRGGWEDRGDRPHEVRAQAQDNGSQWRGEGRGNGGREFRGEASEMERIAGWQGGYREPERRGGPDPQWQGDRWGHERRGEWNSGHRGDARQWQSDRDWQREHRGHGDWHRDQRWRSDWRHPEWRRHWDHGWGGHRYRAPVRYVYPRGYRSYSWRIGYRLPPVFIVSDWYVDWRYYRLAPPPWGCRWLRVDGDLLLVDERSGEIVDALYGFFYY